MEVLAKKEKTLTYRIYDVLKTRVGKENAIHGEELGEMFGIDRRTVRTHIKAIRRSGSLEKNINSGKAGYWVTSRTEYKPNDNPRIRMALSILKTEYSNDGKIAKDGQGKISFGEYYKPFFEAFGEEGRAQ